MTLTFALLKTTNGILFVHHLALYTFPALSLYFLETPMTPAPLVCVRTRSDHGPYFAPTKGNYQCSRLKDIIFHTRLAMEDGEDCIGVFHGDECKGVWYKEWEAVADGEGGMERSKEWYTFYRASEKNYALLSGQF
jgi:hypothetical protein